MDAYTDPTKCIGYVANVVSTAVPEIDGRLVFYRGVQHGYEWVEDCETGEVYVWTFDKLRFD